MEGNDRRWAMILGAFVADAASMGTHWIYDQARLRDISTETPEFQGPDAAHYKDVRGYFAHPDRASGEMSQYGAQMLVMLRSLASSGEMSRRRA